MAEALIWVLLPLFVAAGSAILSYSIMQARMDVALARGKATLAEANASVNTYKITLEERIRAAEEETRRKSLEEFMREIHIEERHYFRESTSATKHRKTMVMQERVCFRNIPLSHWVEREATVEENAIDRKSVTEASGFQTKVLAEVPKPVAAPRMARLPQSRLVLS